MPERQTHIDTLRTGPNVTLGAVTLLTIERTVLHAELNNSRTWLTASKRLHALIVRDATGIRALDADARPMPLATLRQQHPDLDAWLACL